MENKDPKIEKRVERVLQQAGQERYRSNPFLYTRIKEQLAEQEQIRATNLGWRLNWKPILAATLLILNAGVLYQSLSNSGTDVSELISSTYELSGEESNDYFNLFLEE